jgi:lysophospholipase L1-like esterase
MTRVTGFVVCFLLSISADGADQTELVAPTQRVLFLGDSITHAGHYIALLEAHLRSEAPSLVPQLINLGLPSETCSGLSEPDHPFPRPDVHERLDRALDKVKPDVVFACYGMNDGIYYPFSEERCKAYQDGVDRLIAKVKASGAKLVLMTPPAFDPLPLKQKGKLLPAGADKYAWFSIYEGYDDVLKRYAGWIMKQGERVDLVIDLHTPVNAYVAEKRKADADFTMSPDGVHVNNEGHRVLAKTIAAALGIKQLDSDQQLVELVSKRQKLLHDSWLSHVGHKRPGVKAGLPLDEATAKSKEIDADIKQLLSPLGRALRTSLRLGFEQLSLVDAIKELEKRVASADIGVDDFSIHLLGKDLQRDGITRNQRIRGIEAESATVADILTAIVVKANPIRGNTKPNDRDQKLIWVVGPHPDQPTRSAILITTRAGAKAKNYTLPDVFQIK